METLRPINQETENQETKNQETKKRTPRNKKHLETKKTKLGKGSKANHFAYLGDAEIGTESNIGAGTITCNYDGKNKNETKIGDNSFVGTNSSLVAPVTIGSNSYVAAGSVITKDVPDNALGVSRAKQDNKENWSKKKS